jgi:hypothetical protein
MTSRFAGGKRLPSRSTAIARCTPNLFGTPRLRPPRRSPGLALRAERLKRFVRFFRTRRRGPYVRNAGISRHLERDPIPYALETDCPRGAAGFETPHLQIRSAEFCGSGRSPDVRNFLRSAARALAIRDAQVRVLLPGADSLGQIRIRCRGSNPAAPTGQSVSNAYGIGSRSKCHEMAAFRP